MQIKRAWDQPGVVNASSVSNGRTVSAQIKVMWSDSTGYANTYFGNKKNIKTGTLTSLPIDSDYVRSNCQATMVVKNKVGCLTSTTVKCKFRAN